jgi:branched-chain amino acid transport system permease protein
MGNSAQRLRIEFIASLVVLVIVALLPIVLTNMYWQGVVIVSLYFALQAMGWNLLTGYTGQMNLAPAAFAMVGAYGVGMVTYHFELSSWVGIPVGVAAASLIGLILGRIVLRLQGPYVALTTLSFAEILRLIIGNSYTLTRGDLGLNIPTVFQERLPYYYLMLGAVVFVQVALYVTMRSKMGLFLQAIRDDEVAAASRGISIVWWKTLAFVASAAICGLAGTLYAPFAGLISPELGLILNTGLVISMVVIGGMGTMVGPVIGALLVYSTTELLRDFGGYHLIIFAFLVIVIARFFRSGLWGLLVVVADRFNAKPNGNQAQDKGTLDNVVS